MLLVYIMNNKIILTGYHTSGFNNTFNIIGELGTDYIKIDDYIPSAPYTGEAMYKFLFTVINEKMNDEEFKTLCTYILEENKSWAVLKLDEMPTISFDIKLPIAQKVKNLIDMLNQ